MRNCLPVAEASRLVELAEKRAQELGRAMSFAVVDEGGHLTLLRRMDDAQWITPQIACGKAYTAAAFRLPSEMGRRFQQVPMFATAVTVMTQGDFTPQGGGLPLAKDGEILGALGVSGGTADGDVDVARAAMGGTRVRWVVQPLPKVHSGLKARHTLGYTCI